MTRSHLLCALAAFALSGCAGPLTRFETALEEAGIARFATPPTGGRAVEVRASLDPGAPSGRGAVVGDRWVLTLEHVLQGAEQVWVSTTRDGGWVEARVARREAGDPEALVLLEVQVDDGVYGALLGFSGFAEEDALRPGAHDAPATVLTARGRVRWAPGCLLPGDSGAPVLDVDGRVVGLVSGRRGDLGVYVAVRLRSDAPLLALAR